jgi:hypothetical protein
LKESKPTIIFKDFKTLEIVEDLKNNINKIYNNKNEREEPVDKKMGEHKKHCNKRCYNLIKYEKKKNLIKARSPQILWTLLRKDQNISIGVT